MENMTALFTELGRRLGNFGGDRDSQLAICNAVTANPWFSEDDIKASVAAIRSRMLDAGILERWLSEYSASSGKTGKVAVIMAGNIPLVGFFDMMCVLIRGHECHIKPSSKDGVMISYIADLLKDMEPGLPLHEYSDDVEYDGVIATGSDNSNLYFRSRFADVPALLRGSRYSAAVIRGDETPAELRGLSRDVFMYNGLGCRSVSLVFIPEGYDIELLGRSIAPDMVNGKYHNAYLQRKAMLTLRGVGFDDHGEFVTVPSDEFPHEMGQLNYVRYGRTGEITEWVARNGEKIQCVVSRGGEFLRGAKFGEAQMPFPWDYPDGADVIGFLDSI